MQIGLKLFASLRKYLPESSGHAAYNMEIDGNTRVQDILLKLEIPDETPKIILVNGTPVKKEKLLNDGDILSIFPPVAGG